MRSLVQHLRQIKIDDTLVIALVERWRPESHTFHLLVGECTITLENVVFQLGLCVDGKPVTSLTYYDCEQMCTKYTGVVSLKNTLVGSTLKLKWLKENRLLFQQNSHNNN